MRCGRGGLLEMSRTTRAAFAPMTIAPISDGPGISSAPSLSLSAGVTWSTDTIDTPHWRLKLVRFLNCFAYSVIVWTILIQ